MLLAFGLAVSSHAQKGDRPDHDMKPPPAHWVIPPAPVVPADKALATFQVMEGFRMNAYATEPFVEDPVAIAFDSDGRCWVAEMIGYMPNVDGTGEDAPVGRISVLIDTDGDGTVDRHQVFLDKLVLPRAVALADADGSLIWADHLQLHATRIEETPEGPKAGATEVIDAKYVQGGNPEHQANGMLYGLDNWYYNAKHDLRYRKVGGQWVSEKAEVRGQWGIAQDDWGLLYTNTNSNFIAAEHYAPGLTLKNPRHKFTSRQTTSTKDQRLWPSRITPGVNRGYQKETLDENGYLKSPTATCGLTVYRGDQFPAAYQGQLFIPEPAANLVKQLNMFRQPDGTVAFAHPTPGKDFLTCLDERSRIVNAATGPDGALYLVDLYRGILQHSTYVTTYLRKQMIERGLDKPVGLGRIWRVVDAARPVVPGPKLREADNATLIAHLGHANGFWRDTAQRLLVQRGDTSVAPALRKLLDPESESKATPLARLHALWTLEGLDALTAQDCFAAATTDSAQLSGVAVLLASRFADSPDRTTALFAIEAAASSPQAQTFTPLRLNICASLGAFLANPSTRGQALKLLLPLVTSKEGKDDGRFRDLVMSGLPSVAAEAVLREALAAQAPTHPLLADLTASGLRSGDAATIAGFMEAAKTETHPVALRALARAATLTRHLALTEALLAHPTTDPGQTKAIAEGLVDGRRTFGSKYNPLILPEKAESKAALQAMLASLDSKKASDLKPAITFGVREVFLKTEADRAQFALGETHYQRICLPCHQAHGNGQQFLAPPLVGSEWVEQPADKLIALMLDGLTGPISVAGKKYTAPDIQPIMPGFRAIPDVTDEHLAAILTYVRNAWDNGASPVSPEQVKKVRESTEARGPYTEEEWWGKTPRK